MGLHLSRKSRMFAAIERGDVKTVRKMLDKGYHPDSATFGGKCALLVAVIADKKEIVALLLERGGSLSANYYHDELGDTRNETLLHLAAALGRQEIVAQLLEHDRYDRTLIDRLDSNRNTALHLAAANGHLAVVRQLLSAGFDPALKGANGKQPVGYAFQGKHQEIVELLQGAVAARELAKNPPKPAPAPVKPEPPPGPWKLVGPESVAHQSGMEELGYKITDVFNFSSRERIRIVNNLKTRADSVTTVSFNDLGDTRQIEEALEALKRLGGTAPEDTAVKRDLRPRLAPPGRG